jgi:hypothetical protein
LALLKAEPASHVRLFERWNRRHARAKCVDHRALARLGAPGSPVWKLDASATFACGDPERFDVCAESRGSDLESTHAPAGVVWIGTVDSDLRVPPAAGIPPHDDTDRRVADPEASAVTRSHEALANV